jgi:hypothetical protein
MSLDDMLLQRLAEWRPAGGERQTLHLADEGSGWAVAMTADRCDELGVLLWEVGLRRSRPAPDGETLAKWANRLPGQVTGLLESLHVLEIDTLRNEALLRSEEPTPRKEKLGYYEIILTGTQQAAVRRYQGSPNGGRREQIAFALTHEVLAKLVKDLTTIP